MFYVHFAMLCYDTLTLVILDYGHIGWILTRLRDEDNFRVSMFNDVLDL